MREALFVIIGLSTNLFVLALLLYTLLSAKARRQTNELVSEALTYIR